MKLVNKEGGISWMQFVADEVKPLRGFRVPELLKVISERYEFSKSPTHEEASTKGALFYTGRFAEKNINIAALNIQSNLIGVTTYDTDDSEIVLMDLFEYLKEKFEFRDPLAKPQRAYQSDLVVDFENDPDQLIEQFSPLAKMLGKELESLNGDKKPIQFNRIDLASDPSIPKSGMIFLIERRAGVPYATNRFFCKAYLRTDRHLVALAMLEDLLGKTR